MLLSNLFGYIHCVIKYQTRNVIYFFIYFRTINLNLRRNLKCQSYQTTIVCKLETNSFILTSNFHWATKMENFTGNQSDFTLKAVKAEERQDSEFRIAWSIVGLITFLGHVPLNTGFQKRFWNGAPVDSETSGGRRDTRTRVRRRGWSVWSVWGVDARRSCAAVPAALLCCGAVLLRRGPARQRSPAGL